VAVNLHATDRTLFLSADGRSWQVLKTIDAPNLFQAQASVPTLGYVAVGANLQPITSSAPTSVPESGGISRTWLLIAASIPILALAFAAYSLRDRPR
jgi:hypothetical protein